MFHDYIRSLMPCYVENIEQSKNNPYSYRVTLSQYLLNENRKVIDKILSKNKRIKSYEGWFCLKNGDKFALVEFKKSETRHD